MMHMMGNNINFLRECFNDQILRNEPPQGMTEPVGFVGAEAMKPNGSMSTHDHHGINDQHNGRFPVQIINQENNKHRHHAGSHKPAYEGNPVLPGFKNIYPGKGFFKKLTRCGF
jgi:hypothetical protein